LKPSLKRKFEVDALMKRLRIVDGKSDERYPGMIVAAPIRLFMRSSGNPIIFEVTPAEEPCHFPV
jgi:hypothetical protein